MSIHRHYLRGGQSESSGRRHYQVVVVDSIDTFDLCVILIQILCRNETIVSYKSVRFKLKLHTAARRICDFLQHIGRNILPATISDSGRTG